MDEQELALDYFRKLVSLLYREIGAMRRENHEELYARSSMAKTGFGRARKSEAKRLYFQTIELRVPSLVVEPYQDRTGLSIDDIRRIFAEGDWLLGSRHYSFGGPNWARITEATLNLQSIIESREWRRVHPMIAEIDVLCHNNGRIVDKFRELAA